MSTKFLSTLWNKFSTMKQHKLLSPNVWPKQHEHHDNGLTTLLTQYCQFSQEWKRQIQQNDQKRKIIPRLVYLHNPWKYFLTKMNLLRVKLWWDREFKEKEFIRGSKQAAVVLTNMIRKQNSMKIGKLTTPIGYQQITRDMLLSRNDIRLQLIRFETEHLRRAIPMKVATRRTYGRKFCFIDMLFVGLRNTKDFDNPAEAVEINDILRRIDIELKAPPEVYSAPHRILFAEIFIRFRRDYGGNSRSPFDNGEDKDWSVSFYKILTFDILNYEPRN